MAEGAYDDRKRGDLDLEIGRLRTEIRELEHDLRSYMDAAIGYLNELEAIRAVVNEQAHEDALWFQPRSVPEHILQDSLRRLHAVIEGKTPEQCAIKIVTDHRVEFAKVFADLAEIRAALRGNPKVGD
jgi:hypothetical protein